MEQGAWDDKHPRTTGRETGEHGLVGLGGASSMPAARVPYGRRPDACRDNRSPGAEIPASEYGSIKNRRMVVAAAASRHYLRRDIAPPISLCPLSFVPPPWSFVFVFCLFPFALPPFVFARPR